MCRALFLGLASLMVGISSPALGQIPSASAFETLQGRLIVASGDRPALKTAQRDYTLSAKTASLFHTLQDQRLLGREVRVEAHGNRTPPSRWPTFLPYGTVSYTKCDTTAISATLRRSSLATACAASAPLNFRKFLSARWARTWWWCLNFRLPIGDRRLFTIDR